MKHASESHSLTGCHSRAISIGRSKYPPERYSFLSDALLCRVTRTKYADLARLYHPIRPCNSMDSELVAIIVRSAFVRLNMFTQIRHPLIFSYKFDPSDMSSTFHAHIIDVAAILCMKRFQYERRSNCVHHM